jgi:hypothetical protein
MAQRCIDLVLKERGDANWLGLVQKGFELHIWLITVKALHR